jgi:hypothetical protein
MYKFIRLSVSIAPLIISAFIGVANTPESAYHYPFGSVNSAQSSPIEHVFTLRNTTDKAVTIEKIQPTCGCTTAVLGNGAKVDLPAPLAPGASVDVRVAIDPGHLSPGNVDKFVLVFVKEQPEPFATLSMTGTLIAGATYAPSSLNFGKVPYGKEAELPLTVTVDPAILAPGMHPHIACNQEGVDVERNDPPTAAAVPKDGMVEEHYTVKVLPTAMLGTFTGSVMMLVSDGHGGERQVSIPASITGSIVGAVKATPEVVAFAMVTAGEPSTQDVLLEGVSSADIPKVKLLVAGDALAAKLVPAGTADPQPSVHLQVSITSKAHPGSLGSEIIVTLPNGAELLLPVIAYIVAASKKP